MDIKWFLIVSILLIPLLYFHRLAGTRWSQSAEASLSGVEDLCRSLQQLLLHVDCKWDIKYSMKCITYL